MIPYQQAFCLLDYRIVSHFTETCIDLGVFDRLANQSLSVLELAEQTGTHERALHRCLRGLAHFDLFALEPHPRPFLTKVSLTEVSKHLVLTSKLSLRPWHDFCQLAQSKKHQQRRTLWTELLRTGKSIYQLGRDRLFYDYLREHQAIAAAFDRAMESLSQIEIRDILQSFDFSASTHLTEIAGGNGALIRGILEQYESIWGRLFDVPDTIARIKPLLRLEAIGVDIHAPLPNIPGDGILKRILHSYADERARIVLNNIGRAMNSGNKLYIFELVEDYTIRNPYIGIKNLQMLLVHGAPGEHGGPGERTRDEFAALLATTDFELIEVRSLPSIDAAIAVRR
ncbi:MAG: hypothetical protein J7647_10310 [Cyanobacteria bacterium SBLK]|nr:hypothetical protein [Cyanobacteria bacterium SBLK]